MKMFNKVLAAILSLVMLFTLVPVAAFAANPAGSSGAGGSGTAGGSGSGSPSVTWDTPVADGTGADGTITLRLNIQNVIDALQSEAGLRDTLVQIIKDMIDRSNSDVISLDDILEVIPVENILTLLLGADNENVPALIEQFGGMEALMQMFDFEHLMLTADREELVAFLTALENPDDFIHTDALFALDIQWDLETALDYVDQEALDNRFAQLTYDEILALVGGDTQKLKQIVWFDDLMRELLDSGLVDAEQAVDLDALRENPVIREAVVQAVRDDYQSILTPAGIEKVEAELEASGSLSEAFIDSLTDADFNQDALTDLILNTADAEGIDLVQYIKEDYNPFELPGVPAVVLKHVNWDNVENPDIVDPALLMETVLGENGKLTDYITGDNLAAYLKTIDLSPVFDKIAAGEVALEDIIDVQALITAIPASMYTELVGILDREVLVDQVLPNLGTLAKALTREQLENIVVPVLSSLVQNIDLISIDGYEIAKEQLSGDSAGMLAVNFEELLRAVASLIPTLTELAETDGTLLSFNLYAEYLTVSGEERTKDINFEVVLEGDLDTFRKVCAKLAQYISVTREGSKVSVELTVPATVTEIYKKLLELDSAEDLKKQLLSLADKNGQELVELFENLTLDEILAQLEKVDVEKLYNYVLNIAQVETALQRVLDKLGLNYDIEVLQDLNAVLDSIADGVPTLQAVCDAISERINIDVMAILEKAAAGMDQAMTYEVVQKLLNKLYEVPKIGPFIQSVLDENSISEILETYKDQEPVQAISDFIAARLDINLKEILSTMDANEIYQAALDRLADYEAYYERLRVFIVKVLDPDHVPESKWQELARKLIPEAVLRKFLASSLTGLYDGNGVFSAEAEEITIDTGYWSQKLLSFVEQYVTLNDTIKELVAGFLPEATISFGASLTVQFRNLSEVTYLDENGDRLLTTYLANGVDPSVAIDAPVVEGKQFLYWGDANGNIVTAVSGDMTLKAVYDDQAFVVSFVDRYGNLIAKYTIPKGGLLAGLPTDLPTPDELGLCNGRYTAGWYLDGAEVTEEQILTTPVTADVTYVFDYSQTTEDMFFSAGDANVTVTNDGNGNWTVTVDGSAFELIINRANGALEEISSLTVIADGMELRLDSDVIAQLVAASESDSLIGLSAAYGKDTPVTFGNDLYEYSTTDVYSFELSVDGVPFTENFAGSFEIILPFTDAVASNDEQRTTVYVLSGSGGAEAVTAVVTPGVGVTFDAPHFSDYVLVNEYLITALFTGQNVGGTLNLDGQFVPAGATVLSVRPELNQQYGYYIQSITYTNEAGEKVSIPTIGDSMTMPACATTIESVVAPLTFHIYYLVGDQIFDDKTEAEAALKANPDLIPLGYRWNEGEWVGSDAGNTMTDVYLRPALTAIEYTITFEGVTEKVTFTVENYTVNFTIPAVPAKTGMTGAWESFENDPLKLIAELAEAGVTEKTVKAVYTPRSYQVFYPDGATESKDFGSSVTLNITAPAGYTIGSIKVIELANQTEIAVTDGTFTMPAANVRIEVELVPNTIHYSILDRTSGQSQNLEAAFGSHATFTIQVPDGYVLSAAPAIGKLVSFTINSDGSKTLVFAFEVTAEIADNTQIAYDVTRKVPTTVRLSNGMPTTEESPVSSIKNLTFAGFAAPDGTKFEVRNYEFAMFQAEENNSLLWLWILIVVVVLIALVALLYNLHIRGKIKSNFLIRFVVWLVSVFFAICMGVSKLVLMIAQGTSKKDEVDFNAFGMNNPAPADGPEDPGVMTVSEAVEADQAAAAETAEDGDSEESGNADSETADNADAEAAEVKETEAEATESAETDASTDNEEDAADAETDVTQADNAGSDDVAEEAETATAEADAVDQTADAGEEEQSEADASEAPASDDEASDDDTKRQK